MSTNFFTGYAEPKPTSRVMNPPGGRSNNIFGGYDDEVTHHNGKRQHDQPAQQPQLSAHQEAVNNKQHQQHGLNIFDSYPNNASLSINESHRGSGMKPKDNSQSNIFGDANNTNGTNGTHNNGTNGSHNGSHNGTHNGQHNGTNNGHKSALQEQVPAHQAHKQKVRTGFNPITGESYDVEEKEPVEHVEPTPAPVVAPAPSVNVNTHTSSRVLQPPGGKSSRLW